MAGVHFVVDQGFNDALVAISRLMNGNTAELMEELGAVAQDDILQNFEAEASPDSAAWQASQRAQADGGKTLQDRGHLRDSVDYEYDIASVLVGTDATTEAYAAIHQFGGQAGRGLSVTLPARPFIGVGARLEERWGDVAAGWLEELL